VRGKEVVDISFR